MMIIHFWLHKKIGRNMSRQAHGQPRSFAFLQVDTYTLWILFIFGLEDHHIGLGIDQMNELIETEIIV